MCQDHQNWKDPQSALAQSRTPCINPLHNVVNRGQDDHHDNSNLVVLHAYYTPSMLYALSYLIQITTQMKNPRLREGKPLAQGHTARIHRSSDCRTKFLTTTPQGFLEVPKRSFLESYNVCKDFLERPFPNTSKAGELNRNIQ